jgi:4-diphosphocytidyl-2-C-methyl-D-erythritol kinase
MLMNKIILSSPAKINLFLHFIGRRTDGYHELQTIFQLLDYGDTITFESRQDGEIVLETGLPIPEEQNLIWRAAKLLQSHKNTTLGAHICLTKIIPMGGGLGGGSSNAAMTLLGLNQLWNLGASVDELALLGRQLGADVPVFVRGKTAWGEGIGDILTPVMLPETWYVVINPNCVISTAEIYAHPQLTRNTPRISLAQFLAAGGHNDAEAVVRQIFPQVAEALDWLGQFAPTQLTGTGGCLFAGFSTPDEAMRVAKQIPASYQSFIAKGINHTRTNL